MYVLDTNSLISYFSSILNVDGSISKKSLKIIDNAFKFNSPKLILPTIVLVELFHKFCKNEEITALIKYEIYFRIKNQPNMEIQVFDKEILENFIKIRNIEDEFKFDNHDRQVFAAAMTMDCPLISSDSKLIRYNNRMRFVKEILF